MGYYYHIVEKNRYIEHLSRRCNLKYVNELLGLEKYSIIHCIFFLVMLYFLWNTVLKLNSDYL